MVLILIVHIVVCVALIGIVLIQRGRGGGFVESLSGAESIFGTKTSAFLTRTTTILSILFFITCLSLALLSVRQSKSLMKDIKTDVVTEEHAKTKEAIPTQQPLTTAEQQPSETVEQKPSKTTEQQPPTTAQQKPPIEPKQGSQQNP